MWLGIAALVPDDAHNFMRQAGVELHRRYGTTATSTVLEPHVTIKQPFDGDLDRVAAYLDELAASTGPFDLALGDYGEFEDEGVVFLDVGAGATDVLALQRRVIADLGLEPARFESGEPLPYHPHATLAIGLTAAQRRDALASLPQPPGFRFQVERLGLFARVEAGWLVYRRVAVG